MMAWYVWLENGKWRCFSAPDLASATHTSSCIVRARPQRAGQVWAIEAPTRAKAISTAKKDFKSHAVKGLAPLIIRRVG